MAKWSRPDWNDLTSVRAYKRQMNNANCIVIRHPARATFNITFNSVPIDTVARQIAAGVTTLERAIADAAQYDGVVVVE